MLGHAGAGARSAGLAGIAYDLSLRALDQQERVLNDLRARAGTLLAVVLWSIELALN